MFTRHQVLVILAEHLKLAIAQFLGRLTRQLRRLHHLLNLADVRLDNGYANGYRKIEHHPVPGQTAFFHLLAQCLRHLHTLLDTAAFEQHTIASLAQVTHCIRAAQLVAQHLANTLDHMISCRPAETFIQHLQTINIDIQQAVKDAFIARLIERPLQDTLKGKLVHQPGQRVVVGLRDFRDLFRHDLEQAPVAVVKVGTVYMVEADQDPVNFITRVVDGTGEYFVGHFQ